MRRSVVLSLPLQFVALLPQAPSLTGTSETNLGRNMSWANTCTHQLGSAAFNIENIAFFFYKTSYLNEEVSCTEPSPSVRALGIRLPASLVHLKLTWVKICHGQTLALTSQDQLLLTLKILLSFFTKRATLMRRSAVLSLPLQFVLQALGSQPHWYI